MNSQLGMAKTENKLYEINMTDQLYIDWCLKDKQLYTHKI